MNEFNKNCISFPALFNHSVFPNSLTINSKTITKG